MKGYKVFNSDWTCRDMQYSCPGEFELDVTPILCKQGMHFCERLADCFEGTSYSFDSNNKVAEVEAYGDIKREKHKCCTNKLKIIREVPWSEVLTLVNEGRDCTGYRNTGYRNTGYWNTGNCNTGDRNTGNCNTGNWNTGNCNTGSCNTGNCNTGNWNTGDGNTGYWNTGNCNTGDRNTGDWNKSSFNTGCFNTIESNILLFNRPSPWTYRDWLDSEARDLLNSIPRKVVEWVYSKQMTEEEKAQNSSYETTGGYLKVLDESDSAILWWKGLSENDKAVIKAIPNFDAEIFKEITGIDAEADNEQP